MSGPLLNSIMAEPSNSFDELRIIAADTRGLSPVDRDAIKRAADELEHVYRALIESSGRLLEAQQRHIAVNDQLIEARKRDIALGAELRETRKLLAHIQKLAGFKFVPITDYGCSIQISGYRIK